uniref:Uncharacterized protein n=1 Tax=Anguilla anguilla TaxID=7936 RepID=A0A0E9TJ65_ANGAN
MGEQGITEPGWVKLYIIDSAI